MCLLLWLRLLYWLLLLPQCHPGKPAPLSMPCSTAPIQATTISPQTRQPPTPWPPCLPLDSPLLHSGPTMLFLNHESGHVTSLLKTHQWRSTVPRKKSKLADRTHNALHEPALSILSQPQHLPQLPLPSMHQPPEHFSAPQMAFAYSDLCAWTPSPTPLSNQMLCLLQAAASEMLCLTPQAELGAHVLCSHKPCASLTSS